MKPMVYLFEIDPHIGYDLIIVFQPKELSTRIQHAKQFFFGGVRFRMTGNLSHLISI